MENPPLARHAGSRSSSKTAAPRRFDVARCLGEGCLGAVYDAHDRLVGDRVALKLLTKVDPAAPLRLRRELVELAELHHPNLVRLFDLYLSEPTPCISMAFVDGVDWLRYVRGAAGAGFDEARLRDAFAQLIDGLWALHRAGIVHGALKPANARVTASGRVVLLDAGLAKLAPSGGTPPQRTAEDTARYLAPEQIAAGEVGPAADLFSAGVMLHEALTGRLPLPCTAPSAARDEPLHAASSRLRGEGSVVPEDLAALCEDLLCRAPAGRPSMEAVQLRIGAMSGEIEGPSSTPTWPSLDVLPLSVSPSFPPASTRDTARVETSTSESVVSVRGVSMRRGLRRGSSS